MKTYSWLEKWTLAILVVVFAGIVLQAPIDVIGTVVFPHVALIIKSWAEILLAIDAVLIVLVLRKKQRLSLVRTPIIVLTIGLIVWHLLLLPLNFQGVQPALAGLAIDLRYLVMFVLVYLALTIWPEWRPRFLKWGIVGAVVVTGFALLQATVLPADILKYLGYSKATIQPFITIDQNSQFVRINSTLRGPNPLGAYAVIVLSVFLAFTLKLRLPRDAKAQIASAVIAVGGLVALVVSYSRSAWLAAIAAIGVVIAGGGWRRLKPRVWVGIGAGVVLVVGAFVVLGGSSLLSNVFLHDNPTGGSTTKSDEGHVSSLQQASQLTLTHPFGGGIGSTGSASLLGKHSLIIENQYLFAAHEIGWIGAGLAIVIVGLILVKLWQRRSDYLALGVFASGIGLALIGLLLPVWADDTVSIVWWGLAAIALAGNGIKVSKAAKK